MNNRSRIVAGDARWHTAPLLAEAMLRTWLTDNGSLTARIKARCCDFNVRLLRQGRVRVGCEEARLLDVHAREHVYGRDVLLCCGTLPVVYAHSVLRDASRCGPWRAIDAIGTQPLGAALFADPRIERGALAFRRLEQAHPLYSAAARVLGRMLPPLWARRSLFLLRGAPLLVTEAFLPQITALPRKGTAHT